MYYNNENFNDFQNCLVKTSGKGYGKGGFSGCGKGGFSGCGKRGFSGCGKDFDECINNSNNLCNLSGTISKNITKNKCDVENEKNIKCYDIWNISTG